MAEVCEKISCQDAKIIGSIHDEILLEVTEERAEEYARRLKEIMERVGSDPHSALTLQSIVFFTFRSK